MKRNDGRLRAAARSAHASIAGYHYQFAYTALRWWKCKPGEILYCEGNEDLDRILADGGVEEVQIKHRAGTMGPASQAVREALSNFAEAFCEHQAAQRTCCLVFTSTAQLTRRKGSTLGRWMSGKKVDFNVLRGDVREFLQLPTETVAYLNSGDYWQKFLQSVQWQFGAPRLDRYVQQLLDTIRTSRRSEGIDPEVVSASMLSEILTRSGRMKLAERALRSIDLDLLLNDLWLSKGVERYGPTSADASVHFAAVGKTPFGVACVAVFLDAESTSNAEYIAACEFQRNEPEGRRVRSLRELTDRDRGKLVMNLAFDAYAVVDMRDSNESSTKPAQQLLPYVEARGGTMVYVVGDDLAASLRGADGYSMRIVTAPPDSFGSSLALLLAEEILEAWRAKRFTSIVGRMYRKLRVVCDLADGFYYTQAEPPPWATSR